MSQEGWHPVLLQLDADIRDRLRSEYAADPERGQRTVFRAAVKNHLLDVVTELLSAGFGPAGDRLAQRRRVDADVWRVLEIASELLDVPRPTLLRILVRRELKIKNTVNLKTIRQEVDRLA
jgi:hypothetical protein